MLPVFRASLTRLFSSEKRPWVVLVTSSSTLSPCWVPLVHLTCWGKPKTLNQKPCPALPCPALPCPVLCVLHCAVLCVVLCCVLCCILFCCVTCCIVVLYCVLCCIVLRFVLYCVLCCIVFCIVLYCVVLCCVVVSCCCAAFNLLSTIFSFVCLFVCLRLTYHTAGALMKHCYRLIYSKVRTTGSRHTSAFS